MRLRKPVSWIALAACLGASLAFVTAMPAEASHSEPSDEMFFYRGTDGLYRYYQVGSDGRLGAPVLAGDGYSLGWTSIASVDLDGDGQDEMFFYRASDGLYRYYDVNSDGRLGRPLLSGSDYSRGWSSISAVDLDGDGQDEMFFYRASDGLFRYYEVGGDGRLGAPVLSGDGYSRGWSSISAVDLDGDGQDEMFFYRASDGLYRYYEVGADGRLGRPLLSGSDYSKGWTSITAVDLDEVTCAPDPFTPSRVSALERRYPGQSFTAHVYDTRSGCSYSMNPGKRLRTASVFKVMVMAGTLLEAQDDGRGLTSWERSQLKPMITESANSPVRALWRSFGGAPWFARQTRIFGLNHTSAIGDGPGAWGRTTTSAQNQVDLIRQVLLGDWGPLEPEYRAVAWDLMTSVVPSQTWGITQGVPAGWTVAQKNGFAGHITNSVGFVQEPGSDEGYVIAVLSNGWSNWPSGVGAVEQISGWVSAELAHE